MPNKDKSGPGTGATGPRDGRGKGKGYHSNEKGTGSKTGGKEGECK